MEKCKKYSSRLPKNYVFRFNNMIYDWYKILEKIMAHNI